MELQDQGLRKDNPGYVSTSLIRLFVSLFKLFNMQSLICLGLCLQHASNDDLRADSRVKNRQPEVESVVDVEDRRNGEIKRDMKAEEADPWSLPELTDTGIPWHGELLAVYILSMPGFNYFQYITKTAGKSHYMVIKNLQSPNLQCILSSGRVILSRN